MGRLIVLAMMLAAAMTGYAQQKDSILTVMDSLAVADAKLLTVDDAKLQTTDDSLAAGVDSTSIMLQKQPRQKRDWNTWKPNPQRALWLALVLPGAGQIYNRKYWKLPIIYGGFMGCIYALSWNNMMYKDYSQAYLDIMDDDPTTESYNKFLHLGVEINQSNEERYKKLFKSRKDKYRRWRDLSFFAMLGVYAISVIDAYVDAELSVFDISPDLSMRVGPAVINQNNPLTQRSQSSIGIGCSFRF